MDLGVIQTTKLYWNVKSSKMQRLIFKALFFLQHGMAHWNYEQGWNVSVTV